MQALPLPAVADGGDFRITTARGSEEMAEDEYFETVPQGLDSADSSQAPRLGALIAGPKGKQIQQCTRKCVPTCIRGGQGAPGLGPMSMRWVHVGGISLGDRLLLMGGWCWMAGQALTSGWLVARCHMGGGS